MKEIAEKQEEESKLRDFFEAIDFQTAHVNELAQITGIRETETHPRVELHRPKLLIIQFHKLGP